MDRSSILIIAFMNVVCAFRSGSVSEVDGVGVSQSVTFSYTPFIKSLISATISLINLTNLTIPSYIYVKSLAALLIMLLIVSTAQFCATGEVATDAAGANTLLIASHALLNNSLIPPHIVPTIKLVICFHIPTKAPLIAPHIPSRRPFITFITVSSALRMVNRMLPNKLCLRVSTAAAEIGAVTPNVTKLVIYDITNPSAAEPQSISPYIIYWIIAS